MALPPLELPPIEKGSPCCRAALLPLSTTCAKQEFETLWCERTEGVPLSLQKT